MGVSLLQMLDPTYLQARERAEKAFKSIQGQDVLAKKIEGLERMQSNMILELETLRRNEAARKDAVKVRMEEIAKRKPHQEGRYGQG